MVQSWEEFYAKNAPPADFANSENLMKKFVSRHLENNTKIVLVTSGGTTVPLEHNTVRFVDNFSAGTRGSVSAEYFLQHGYAVIFMYRLKTLEPFSRHFMGQKFLEILQLSEVNGKKTAIVAPEYAEKVTNVFISYKDALDQGKLLQIGFTTISEYLWLLRSACQALAPMEHMAMLYLAAAVSDFYVPSEQMSVHKIPSSGGAPTISLHLVPKVMVPLASLWVPKAFIVSFKLETDKSLLITKAREALNKYKHKLVIANILQNRRQEVTMVSNDDSQSISLTDEELSKGIEIEKYMVEDLVEKHTNFIKNVSKEV